MYKFNKSEVLFNEEEHSYFLGEKRLMGITGLIHSILGLGVYPEANAYVQDKIIPRAGSRGTAVHHAIQTYDELGVKQTIQTVHTRYGCRERDNIEYVDETWDVSSELEYYISHLVGFTPVANEYTVSDNNKWASQIDNVWINKQTDGIWLVDTKTNNLKLYPLCGYFRDNYFTDGVEALKEYLSWQLSIYAVLFERQNPGMKVEGLACNWLRSDDAALWEIPRKPTELVEELLKSEYEFTDFGTTYFHPDLSVFGITGKEETLPVIVETLPSVPVDVVEYVTSLIEQEKELKARMEEAKKGLRLAMETHGVKSFDFGTFKATISADSERSSFDTTRFKKDHPDLYDQYIVRKSVKGGFTLK